MKIEHIEFVTLLKNRGINKKIFSNYTKISYNTVTGWKKKNKVPHYAMILLKTMPPPKTVTAKQLIDAGMPRAIFWNNNLRKEIPSDILIISTLKRSYNDFVIHNFINFFGKEMLQATLIKHRNHLSDKLIQTVMTKINTKRTPS
jgi:hypothetical protein